MICVFVNQLCTSTLGVTGHTGATLSKFDNYPSGLMWTADVASCATG